MKFSGKVWSDHGTTWFNCGSIRVNGSAGRRSSCLLSLAIAQTTAVNKSLSFARWQQVAGLVVPRTTACYVIFLRTCMPGISLMCEFAHFITKIGATWWISYHSITQYWNSNNGLLTLILTIWIWWTLLFLGRFRRWFTSNHCNAKVSSLLSRPWAEAGCHTLAPQPAITEFESCLQFQVWAPSFQHFAIYICCYCYFELVFTGRQHSSAMQALY